jgi:hypothetical protein
MAAYEALQATIVVFLGNSAAASRIQNPSQSDGCPAGLQETLARTAT